MQKKLDVEVINYFMSGAKFLPQLEMCENLNPFEVKKVSHQQRSCLDDCALCKARIFFVLI